MTSVVEKAKAQECCFGVPLTHSMDAGVALSCEGSGESISHSQPVTFSVYFCRNLGTVGAVALDYKENVAYATSAGGIVNKITGRIRDPPCLGRMGAWLSPVTRAPGSPFLPLLLSIAASGFPGVQLGWRGVPGSACLERLLACSRHPVFLRL